MKPNQKKVNYLRVILSSVAVVLIVAASFMIPILIYIALLVLGILVIWNMKRIEHIYTTAEEVVDASEPVAAEPEETTPKKPIADPSIVIENYIKNSIANGHKLKAIVGVLKDKGYDMVVVKEVCNKLGLLNKQEQPKAIPEPEAITEELNKEIEEEPEEESELEKLKKENELLKKQRGGRPKKKGKHTKKVEVQGKVKEVEIDDDVNDDMFE